MVVRASLLALVLTGGAAPQERKDEPRIDFAREVLPLFKANCFHCHGARKSKGQFRLDSRDAAMKGGASGPALVPGRAAESRLYRLLVSADPEERMPRETEALSRARIETIRRWIDQGAVWPDEARPESHWAFAPPAAPAPPRPGHPIDAFIAAKLEARGLRANPPAARPLLLRRLTIDLIGLPPLPREIQAFVEDASPEAYEKVVDRLLADPRYGERWGRHFMDVWRYADPDAGGLPQGLQIAPHMWRWRDWIIDSLNADKGYDRMVREMLAGDELAPSDPDALRATAYLARNKNSSRDAWLHDTVDHAAQGFLGITLQCARCHDHPVDPILQTEYYAFRACFEGLDVRTDPLPEAPDRKKDGVTRAFERSASPTYLHVRGNELDPDRSRPIPPGVPAALGTDGFEGAGRRDALARWLTGPRNPLAARVAVNHVWLRHFGEAIVPTVNDFGRGGAAPSHPELLDWLASWFAANGWRLKALHRLIVTSAAYRRSSAPDPEGLKKDPDNRLLWRMTPRRMEAEVVRDSILHVAGRLDPAAGGPPVDARQGETSLRRSLYFQHSPYAQMTFLRTFDGAPFQECYRRAASVQPRQSLALLNSELALVNARLLARGLDPGRDARAFVEAAFAALLSRPPSPAERGTCLEFLEDQGRSLPADGTTDASNGSRPSKDPALRARENLVHLLFSHHDFVTVR